MTLRVSAIALVVTFGLVAAGCTVPEGSIPATVGQRVSVPEIPLAPALSWDVQAAALDAVPCAGCTGAAADVPRFFYGELPLGTADALTRGSWPSGAPVPVRDALGNYVVSGYFGGIYLRANLASIGADPATAGPAVGVLDSIGRLTSQQFDGFAAELLRVADTGTDQEVLGVAGFWAAVMSLIHSYNRGYLEVLLAYPPAGVTAPVEVSCPTPYDCRTPSLPLAALDGLGDVRTALAERPTAAWQDGGALLDQLAAASVDGGRAVWQALLTSTTVDAAAYPAIVDVSVGFLELIQAALLGNAAAAFGGDAARGRVALRLTAAVVLWAGSYFLGLSSPLPNTTTPTLNP